MAYKCSSCGANDVENPGDLCELCMACQDPYLAEISKKKAPGKVKIPITPPSKQESIRKGSARKILLDGGDQRQVTEPEAEQAFKQSDGPSPVTVLAPGQVLNPAGKSSGSVGAQQNSAPANSNLPLSVGITKNITVDKQQKSFIGKWFRSLFTGVPFTLGNEVMLFQVFPDFSGSAVNAMGNACDQVIVYGKINVGAISENNDVEVYGRRDSNNNVIAKKIHNKASGTSISPKQTISTGIVWLFTLLFLALAVFLGVSLGVEGIIWIVVMVLLLTNLPAVLKISVFMMGIIFSFMKRR